MDTATSLVLLLFCVATAGFLTRRYFAAGSSANRQVQGEIVGHHSVLATGMSPGAPGNLDLCNYAAVYAFSYQGKDYRVTDPMWREKPTPPIGTRVTLIFPDGQPEQAAPRRRWFYALFAVLCTGAALAIFYRLLTN